MSINIANNLTVIKEKITKLNPKAELIAVSKNHNATAIIEAIEAGQCLFGENKVQEAAEKFPELRNKFPDIQLHLIGPLQTNKAKDALQLFDVIETLDREKLAIHIAKNLNPESLTKEFFIQVNIGQEPQKAGIEPKQLEEFYNFCTAELGLKVTGLMCIPPAGEHAFMYFALLKNLSKKIGKPLKLSMGMSGDYEEALEMGADFIRIGTAIFGERS